jgi:hypothetical protein
MGLLDLTRKAGNFCIKRHALHMRLLEHIVNSPIAFRNRNRIATRRFDLQNFKVRINAGPDLIFSALRGFPNMAQRQDLFGLLVDEADPSAGVPIHPLRGISQPRPPRGGLDMHALAGRW